MAKKILLPFNFTEKDNQALEFVIGTFSGGDYEITLFNVYIAPPEIDMRGSPVMEKISGNLNYLRQKAMENENALKDAKKKLVENGFRDDQVRLVLETKIKDTAQDIVNLAINGKFDVVVLNRKPGKVARFFTGSIFEKVITSLKNVTVCVVT